MTIQEMIQAANEAAQFVKSQGSCLLTPFTQALDTANTGMEINLQGNFIYIYDATDGAATINVQFNKLSSDAPKVPLVKSFGYVHPFTKLYVSWTAQAGKSVTFFVGSFAKEIMDVIDNRSQADITTSLATIATNTGATKTSVDGVKSNTRGLNGDTGTQFNVDGFANNSSVTLKTFTGKTGYVTSFSLHGVTSNTGSDYFRLDVQNGASVHQFYLDNSISGGGEKFVFSKSFPTPVKIADGFKIVLVSGAAGTFGTASVHGWEE